MWTQHCIWTYCYEAIIADVHPTHNGALRKLPSFKQYTLQILDIFYVHALDDTARIFPPFSKGCPFAFFPQLID